MRAKENLMNQVKSRIDLLTTATEETLGDVLGQIFPIQSGDDEYTLYCTNHHLDKENVVVPFPSALFVTAPLYVSLRLENNMTAEIFEKEIFLADFPHYPVSV